MIAIKTLKEMPISCDECPLCIMDDFELREPYCSADDILEIADSHGYAYDSRPKKCPLVEVEE